MPQEKPVSDPSPPGDALFVQSLARGMSVLEAFQGADRALSLTQIATRTGLTRSAAQRIVHTFRKLGYLTLAEDGRGFRLDLPILDLTHDYLRMNPLVRRASPVLLELRRNVRERVDLSLFDGQRMVYAARMQSKRETFFATLVGHSVPTACTSGGWAVLSQLPPQEVDAILAATQFRQFTPRTITDPQLIRDQIALARENGHALALEQILMGEIAIGVAIPDATGRPVAAIHIVASLSEWDPEAFRRSVAPLAAEAVRSIVSS
ncbi:MAG: IclR family transcriptional regulator C-terminal domain-containing protein [Cypionkella sp.]|uniref:IclR family transcriptional regulator n=1 Tax=Cypionkella sp. TaxID=2811411 RepID=UPI002AB9B370|nr:IclR family transcriptional regulator C-terminal domain-containing protein [Cypionkella sp.]MDZ4311523.1 IclR family transcriptional regulator C-terminal domain-containing protein [Cypionkella sp.]MDZ4393980.1 IclR family transcriptional regulator C-terminal domain-containing protein [Cypionkella sp.]